MTPSSRHHKFFCRPAAWHRRATALADADKIKAAIEDTAKTARAIAGAASTISERLAVIRRSHLLVICGLGLLYFIGGAWLVWNDHRAVQKTIYQQVALHTKDALERLQSDYIKEHLDTLKALVDTGVTVSVMHDSDGDTTLYFQGRPGVSLFKPRYSSGKYAISAANDRSHSAGYRRYGSSLVYLCARPAVLL